jgi:hypothetical protein
LQIPSAKKYLELNTIILENGAHLKKDLESLPYTYPQKMPHA